MKPYLLYPADHVMGAVVPGGSSCSNCRFYAGQQLCANKYFISSGWGANMGGPSKPRGSNVLPTIAYNYCCDLWEMR